MKVEELTFDRQSVLTLKLVILDVQQKPKQTIELKRAQVWTQDLQGAFDHESHFLLEQDGFAEDGEELTDVLIYGSFINQPMRGTLVCNFQGKFGDENNIISANFWIERLFKAKITLATIPDDT